MLVGIVIKALWFVSGTVAGWFAKHFHVAAVVNEANAIIEQAESRAAKTPTDPRR